MLARVPAKPFAVVRDDEGRRFVCVQGKRGLMVVPDACKHRGGPLSKGKLCERTGGIVCPWHDILNGPSDLAKRELPSARDGEDLIFDPAQNASPTFK